MSAVGSSRSHESGATRPAAVISLIWLQKWWNHRPYYRLYPVPIEISTATRRPHTKLWDRGGISVDQSRVALTCGSELSWDFLGAHHVASGAMAAWLQAQLRTSHSH